MKKAMFPYFTKSGNGLFDIEWYAELKDAKAKVEKKGKGYIWDGKTHHVYQGGQWTKQRHDPQLWKGDTE